MRHHGLVGLVASDRRVQRLKHLLVVVQSLPELAARLLDFLEFLKVVLKNSQRLIVDLLLLNSLESLWFPAQRLEFVLLDAVKLLAQMLVGLVLEQGGIQIGRHCLFLLLAGQTNSDVLWIHRRDSCRLDHALSDGDVG